MQVVAQGFGKVEQTNITLLVNQNYRADFRLAVGSVEQAVKVSANPIQVESTSTQLGDVVETDKILSLPLNGRSYLDLLGLQAGVLPIQTDTGHNAPVSGDLNAGNVSVNGQREDANTFLIDGATVQEFSTNGASVIPTLDSIEEFRWHPESAINWAKFWRL
jgi:hypothetical protein